MKPPLSHKIRSTSETALIEDGNVVNSPGGIVDILNTYYVNVTVDIGPSDVLSQGETLEEITRVHGLNPSVRYIRTNLRKSESFVFSLVNESEICQNL